MQAMCLFCGKIKPQGVKCGVLCSAKGEIMSAYAKQVPSKEYWKVMHAIETGVIDLDYEAERLLRSRGVDVGKLHKKPRRAVRGARGERLPAWWSRFEALRKTGLKIADIADILNEEGFKAKQGGKIREATLATLYWYHTKRKRVV